MRGLGVSRKGSKKGNRKDSRKDGRGDAPEIPDDLEVPSL
jgi:hypothetical protein